MHRLVLSIVFVSLLLAAAVSAECIIQVKRSQTVAALKAYEAEWRGVPYRLGGTDRSGIDCSAFVRRVFADLFNQPLPRTTIEQTSAGRKVPRDKLQTKDLVFFKTNRTTWHVGVYVDQNRFLHASTSRGPMISDLNLAYWQERYRFAVRVEY